MFSFSFSRLIPICPISAPISGRVGELSVEEGDDVQNGAVIATIYDDRSLEVTVPFTSADAQSLYTGQPVTVTLGDTFEQLSGTIYGLF